MKHAALCCSLVAAGSIALAASPTSPGHEFPAGVLRRGSLPPGPSSKSWKALPGISRPAPSQPRRDHRALPRPTRRIPHCPRREGGSTDKEADQWRRGVGRPQPMDAAGWGGRSRDDSAAEPRRGRGGDGGGRRMRAGGGAALGALALALVRHCLLLGPLGLRSAGAQDGEC